MGQLISLLFQLLVLVPLGFVLGRFSEKKHLRSLEEREALHSNFLITDLKSFPMLSENTKTPEMFIGEVTVATDYYKSFIGKLRNFFGGEMVCFEILKIRARREATMKIIEQAHEKGYNAICNLRLETADIGGSTLSRKSAVTVSVIASATAYNIAS